MDQQAAYEILIAEKLEQLSVPDMMDAIWARIETQLDIDMPTDEGPADPPGNTPSGSGLWNIAGMALFITALIAIIYFTNKKSTTTNNNTTGSDDSTAVISAPGNNNNKPPPTPTIVLPSPSSRQDPGTILPEPVIVDSAAGQSTDPAFVPVPGAGRDSLISIPAPVISSPDSAKKKGRGVKGISDSDYRITPQRKDST